MFGYVTICEPELKIKDWRKYRAYYCGLCRTLKERYGNVGQMTLTYDMTFAVILLTSLYECEGTTVFHRCKTHPVKKQTMLSNEITEYCADMNVLLAYYHMKDNWDDEKKISGFAGAAVLKNKARKAAKMYPRQARVIRKQLQELADYEAQNCTNIDLPAGSFGTLMAELFVYRKDMWEDTLRKLGFFLGKFIYIMDACEDLEKDIKENCYNPLKEMHEKYMQENRPEEYEAKCRDMLCMMIAETSAAFEKLPCLEDADILRNILYAGVWTRYNRLHADKEKEKPEKQK